MENLVDLNVSAVLDWLNSNSDNNSQNSNSTKFINKVENVSFRWNNLNITVITKRPLKDYMYWFFFFILRCIVIFLIPLYLISVFWLNFTNSFGGIKDNMKSNIENTGGLGWSILGKTELITNYFWMMDELLEK